LFIRFLRKLFRSVSYPHHLSFTFYFYRSFILHRINPVCLQLLKKQGHDVEKIRGQIEEMVVKTILSMLPDITIWDHVTNKSKLVR